MNYGTVLVSLADRDKEEALPLVRRFYNLGFNIEATSGTANILKSHGIRTRVKKKISDGSEEILDSIRQGYVSYVINTRDMNSPDSISDGYEIRRCAVENNVTMFTSLDTVRCSLTVLGGNHARPSRPLTRRVIRMETKEIFKIMSNENIAPSVL